MALSCREIVELVTDYLDGDLDHETTQQVRAHLDLCDGCERYVRQMRTTTDAVGDIQPETLPDEIRSELLTAFRTYHR